MGGGTIYGWGLRGGYDASLSDAVPTICIPQDGKNSDQWNSDPGFSTLL